MGPQALTGFLGSADLVVLPSTSVIVRRFVVVFEAVAGLASLGGVLLGFVMVREWKLIVDERIFGAARGLVLIPT